MEVKCYTIFKTIEMDIRMHVKIIDMKVMNNLIGKIGTEID